MDRPLWEIFGSALGEAQRARLCQPDLAERLDEVVRGATAAWPDVRVSPATFVAHLGEVIARPENEQAGLEDLHAADLYLACACAAGDARALAVCDAQAGPEIDRALWKMDLPQATIDEVKQALRERLYVGEKERPPLIAAYSGRGRLVAWMRVVAVRDALQLIRGQKRVRLFEEEELMRLADVASTPVDAGLEQEHMKLLYRAEFKAAFRRAVEALPAKEREILRAHFVDGQTIDQLGEAHGVHRATAARWVDRARRSLVAAIRRTLMNELRVDEATYQSLLRLVASRLDLSVRLMFDEKK